ncbi:MAG: hypothetical protein ACYTFI_20990 [Planctomycetota bacterium]
MPKGEDLEVQEDAEAEHGDQGNDQCDETLPLGGWFNAFRRNSVASADVEESRDGIPMDLVARRLTHVSWAA